MLNNIPEEFKQYKQWVGWIYKYEEGKEKPTKVPINLYTGQYASPTNPLDWCWFTDISSSNVKVEGYGFVITPEDPFTCLDFDPTNDPEIKNLQVKIYNAFPNSYAEISPSGQGCHKFIKAKLESNRNRSKVEIYTRNHFMTMTGNVIDNSPIKEYQELAYKLWEEMAPVKEVKVGPRLNEPELFSDYDILCMASSAINGEKFIKIYENNWQEYFPSEAAEGKTFCNEADQSLVNILAFYTRNREQIKRIFRASPLGQRAKANREDYFEHPRWGMIDKAFDQMCEPLDLSVLKQNLEQRLAQNQQSSQTVEQNNSYLTMPSSEIEPPATSQCVEISGKPVQNSGNLQIEPVKTVKSDDPYSLPPGLVGAIAKFIYEAAPLPVPEIALAGALGLMSGVCGRSYNISGTGLNYYTLLLGLTGSGKEGMAKTISKLIGEVAKTVPAAMEFIGPSEIASAQALIKYLNKFPSFVSMISEFDTEFANMCHAKADGNQRQLRKAYLNLYHKSGHGEFLGKIIYSDKDKNTDLLYAPSFSVLAECTPEAFYELLDKRLIKLGMIPRFTIIEYTGDRPKLNKNHSFVKPSRELLDQFSALCAYSLQLNNGNNVLEIKHDTESQMIFDEYEEFCRQKINSGSEDTVKRLWNRAHLKALKLAGLLSVGCNYINPVTNAECTKWAINLVNHDVQSLIKRFEVGEVGTVSVQNEQITDMRKAFKRYITSDFKSISGYPSVTQELWDKKVVPHSFITCICRAKVSFKNDKLGPLQAIKNCITSMIECDEICELGLVEKRKNNLPLTKAKLYVVSGMKV